MTEKFHIGKNGGEQLIRNQNLFEINEGKNTRIQT
jgi:hypothetical protein